MEKGSVDDLARWEDFPFPEEIPEGYEVRRGEKDGVALWSIFHPASGMHLDAVEHPVDTSRRVFWVRLFVTIQQAVGQKHSEKRMRRVILESPYAGDIEANCCYARRALRDSLMRGEAPLASHLLYTQDGVLRDGIVPERRLGIAAGLAWMIVAECHVFYTDRGWSRGMIAALEENLTHAMPDFELRAIDGPLQLPPVTVTNGLSSIDKLRKLARIFSDAEANTQIHPIHVDLSGQVGDGI